MNEQNNGTVPNNTGVVGVNNMGTPNALPEQPINNNVTIGAAVNNAPVNQPVNNL